LVLLDVMLPEANGFDVCREVRRRLPEQPVVMLTAKGAEQDILTGFGCGADDYVCKPFSVRELVARIEALLRRTGRLRPAVEAPFPFGPWQVDPATLRAAQGGESIELSRRELELLQMFSRERGRIVSRRRLLRDVWGVANAENLQTRTVDMHIAKLRKKIDVPSATPDDSLIETVRGEGYRYR
jgi:DNA-binding response OmpR family regulator